MCISFCIFVGDLNYREIVFATDITIGAPRMAPVRTCYVRPPLKMIVERNRMVWRGKDNTAGDKILRRSAGKILGSRSPFRDCHVSCSLNELAELRVGYV